MKTGQKHTKDLGKYVKKQKLPKNLPKSPIAMKVYTYLICFEAFMKVVRKMICEEEFYPKRKDTIRNNKGDNIHKSDAQKH